MKKIVLLMMLGVILLSACATGEGLEPHEAWTREAKQGENGNVYVIIHNHTDVDDALLSVTSDVAEAVELHLSEVDSNDVMEMTPLESIAIPAGEEIAFESGSYHIMLVNLKQDLHIGDEISITLHFENYPDVTVTVPVQEAGGESHNHP
jgi:hypothetical protein